MKRDQQEEARFERASKMFTTIGKKIIVTMIMRMTGNQEEREELDKTEKKKRKTEIERRENGNKAIFIIILLLSVKSYV